MVTLLPHDPVVNGIVCAKAFGRMGDQPVRSGMARAGARPVAFSPGRTAPVRSADTAWMSQPCRWSSVDLEQRGSGIHAFRPGNRDASRVAAVFWEHNNIRGKATPAFGVIVNWAAGGVMSRRASAALRIGWC